MNPTKVVRENTHRLTDLPNIGKAGAADLKLLGIHYPRDLLGQNPLDMYNRLCELTGSDHDPCVIDVFISVTRFIDGEKPKPWWDYTAERKRMLSQQ